jgi:hypothetical protein
MAADTVLIVEREAYQRLIGELRGRDCYFLSASLEKTEDDVFKQPRGDPELDFGDSKHWYVFSPSWTVEDMIPRKIHNIHQGEVYSIVASDGGPYLDLLVWPRTDSCQIMIGYKSSYWANRQSVPPPEELKKLYRQLVKMLRAAAPAVASKSAAPRKRRNERSA